jgi:ABC-type lipoprotein export system ATPase subunit
MIKTTNLNKIYHPRKTNENHVVNNANVTFPEKGLVVILGQSGSGKTTLLNLLSGMDKPTSGTIEILDNTIEKYQHKKWDKIRNHDIGYIFQNYYLLKKETVFYNIALTLKMSGVTDEALIEKRVKDVLQQVGMIEYIDRKANQLSGGQKQRIAFARALANNPQIIIADEPTGNLDSKTTIEIMNILKNVSSEKLVIMVTHETNLADFYADKIIEIKNGKIVENRDNQYQGDLSVIQEHIIFLKDYNLSKAKASNTNLLIYDDQTSEKLEDIGVTLIKKNDSLYVKVDSNQYKRIKYIDDASEIELLDQHYQDTKNVEKNIDLSILEPLEYDENASAILWKDAFKNAFKKLSNMKYGGKMLLAVLAMIGAVIGVSVGLIGKVYHIDESNFVNKSRNYLTVYASELTLQEVQAYEDYEFVESINLITEPITFRFETEPYYQIYTSIELDVHPTPIQHLDESALIKGEMPSSYGIVLDKIIADRLIYQYADRGVETYDDVLAMSLKIQASGQDYDIGDQNSLLYEVTGIAQTDTPTIYLAEELIYTVAIPTLIDYRLLGDGFEVVEGNLPTSYKQLMLSEESTLIRSFGVPSSVGISTGRYDVTGVYKYNEDNMDYVTDLLMVTSADFIEANYFFTHQNITTNFTFLVYTEDVQQALKSFEELGITAESDYLSDYDQYLEYNFEENFEIYVFSLLGIAISAISIYFIMRSSLLARIYEVSVYRALGAKKRDIRKLFVSEILLTTTLSSLIGFILMMILLLRAQNEVARYIEIVHYNIIGVSLGVLGIYTIQIVFGLIPVENLMRKTPAEIFKKYDL